MTPFHRRIGWLAIVLLLLLRIPYSIVLTYASVPSTGWGPALFELGTYLLTVFLIWWEREELAAVHIDGLSVALIVLFKPGQTLLLRYWGVDTPLTFPHPAGLLIWAASISLVVVFWRTAHRRGPVTKAAAAWLVAGLLTGVALSAIANLEVFRHTQDLIPLPSVTASTGLAFFYQLGFAAASEEPLFRGFLWGYLRRSGWSHLWTWLAQAVLFMLAHLYFINGLPFQFWILVPAAALILGLFAWRSRSVAPGMLAHAAFNSGAYILLLNALAAAARAS
jgi:membrane protease YdiL (CAAX protease family)